MKPNRTAVTSARNVLVLVAMLVGVAATDVHAAKVMFGTQDHLNKLEDVEVKGRDGEALYLGYKHSFHSFIAPYSVTDDGYILGVVGQNRFYKLDAAMIERMQAAKQLPKPLPAYTLSFWDYLFGHLLWLIGAGVIIGIVVAQRNEARKKTAMPFAQEGFEQAQQGNLDGAIESYNKALEISPKFTDVLRLRAEAYRSKGELDRAIADLSKAIAAEGKNAELLLGRGSVFEAKGLINQAIDDYTRAIKASKAAIAYYARAAARSAIGEFGAAIDDFTAAIKKEEAFSAAYEGRAAAREQIGKTAEAEADRAKAAQLRSAYAQPDGSSFPA